MQLAQMDAVAWLKSLPDNSIDLMITDPPYESLEKHRARGTTTRLKESKGSSNRWFSIFPNDRFPEFFAEVFRVLKKNRHFYLMCDQETMFHVKPLAEAAGFTFWKPVVWDKCAIGMGYHYRNRHEFVLFFEKGKRKLNSLAIPDVLQLKRIVKEWLDAVDDNGKPKYLADAPRFMGYIRATAHRYRQLGPLLKMLDQIEGTEPVVGFAYGRM